MNFMNKGLPMEDPECVRCSACVAMSIGVLALVACVTAQARSCSTRFSITCADARGEISWSNAVSHWWIIAGRGEPRCYGQTTSRDFSPPFAGPSVLLFGEASRAGNESHCRETPLAVCGGTILAKPIVPCYPAPGLMLMGFNGSRPAPSGIGLYRDAETLRGQRHDRLPVTSRLPKCCPRPDAGNGQQRQRSSLNFKAQGATSIHRIVACPAGVEQFQRTS